MVVKVFSATKQNERGSLGDRVTSWLKDTKREDKVMEYVVRQSSDSEYHCLTIVLFCSE